MGVGLCYVERRTTLVFGAKTRREHLVNIVEAVIVETAFRLTFRTSPKVSIEVHPVFSPYWDRAFRRIRRGVPLRLPLWSVSRYPLRLLRFLPGASP